MAQMTPQDYVGRTFLVTCRALRLPTGREVVEGTTFRFLQEHLDRGCRPDLWLLSGNAELAPDTPQRVPTGGKGGTAPGPETAPAAPAPAPVMAPSATPAPSGGKG